MHNSCGVFFSPLTFNCFLQFQFERSYLQAVHTWAFDKQLQVAYQLIKCIVYSCFSVMNTWHSIWYFSLEGRISQVFWLQQYCDTCSFLPLLQIWFIYFTSTIKKCEIPEFPDFIVTLGFQVHFETVYLYFVIHRFFSRVHMYCT